MPIYHNWTADRCGSGNMPAIIDWLRRDTPCPNNGRACMCKINSIVENTMRNRTRKKYLLQPRLKLEEGSTNF